MNWTEHSWFLETDFHYHTTYTRDTGRQCRWWKQSWSRSKGPCPARRQKGGGKGGGRRRI